MSRKDALTHDWYYVKEEESVVGCARCGKRIRLPTILQVGSCRDPALGLDLERPFPIADHIRASLGLLELGL